MVHLSRAGDFGILGFFELVCIVKKLWDGYRNNFETIVTIINLHTHTHKRNTLFRI